MKYRTITITEVNPESRRILGRDEFGQRVAITSHYLQPLTIVPQKGEMWLVHEQGGQ